jgi:hypothetical protein
VVALILATTLSGSAAERFATAGYLAAIFAAAALVIGRFLPRSGAQTAVAVPAFPVFLTNSVVVVIFVSVIAGLVSLPGAEVFALVLCAVLVVFAVLVRCGAIEAFHAALMRGGFAVGASRYAVLVAVCALALGAVLSEYAAETIVRFAFQMAVVATALIAASLLTPTKAGVYAQKAYFRTISVLDRLARAFVFERTASYAAIVAVAAIVTASFLPAEYREPFAIAAYAAALAAAFGVAMECRRLRS